MMIRSKGIVISDLKKFLERKKLEHAAQVKEKQSSTNSAESHTRLKNNFQVQSKARGGLVDQMNNCGRKPALQEGYNCLMCDNLLLARPDINNKSGPIVKTLIQFV